MNATIRVSIPRKLKIEIDRVAKRENLRQCDIVRSALNRFVASQEFWAIREALVPEAKKKGIYTDEDVFKLVS